MDEGYLRELIQKLKNGSLSEDDLIQILKSLPFEKVRSSHIDHHRHLRHGIPEVVFAKDKPVEDVVAIGRRIYEKSGRVLITRAREEIYRAIQIKEAEFFPRSGVIVAGIPQDRVGLIAIVSAGTSDGPVAEEADLTASFLGSKTLLIEDVGVAGIHRLFAYMDSLMQANVVIAVAGMEGALPTVVASITGKVVIGVPTSTGYGTSLGGLTPLFSMLNTCVPLITVVNIDNGFGAACVAHKINLLVASEET